MVDILMDTDTLSIVGPPDVVTLVTETGATGPRGSLWFTGAGMPSSLTIPDYDSLKVGDMYIDQNDGYIYQMILLPSNTLDWISVGMSMTGPTGPKGDTGDTGPAGPPNSLAIGTVTTGAAGSSASASITGDAPSQTLNLTIPRGNVGDPTEYELRGTGMPNGIVTASPGTYYTDTAGTNGAWRWLKKAGTGNTGWTVVYGDTGWRVLSSWTTAGVVTGNALPTGFSCTSGVAGKIQIRRINEEVMYRIYGATISAGNQITYQTGFGITSQYVVVPVYMNDTITNAKIGGPCIYMGSGVTHSSYGSYFKYITDDSWPAVLPGTSA